MAEPQDPATAGHDRLRAGHADREQVIEALNIPAEPAAAGSARPPAPARRRPLARAAAWSGGCLVIAFAAMQVARLSDPGNTPGTLPGSLALPSFLVANAAVFAALLIVIYGVGTAVGQRRSRRQLPPRPGPGGHALDGERPGGTGHRPVPPGPRPDQPRADLRSDSSRPRRPHSSGRGARTPRGIRPVPDAG